jgi:hypothetical protein
MSLEELESRQLFNITLPGDREPSRHHAHAVHHQHMMHHMAHMHRMHHLHFLHTQHRAHVLRSTVPAPIVLTAQQRTNWVGLRDVFSQRRIHI